MQTQLGEHRTMFHAGDFHQFSDVRFCVFAANIATQCAALLVRRERHLLMQSVRWYTGVKNGMAVPAISVPVRLSTNEVMPSPGL